MEGFGTNKDNGANLYLGLRQQILNMRPTYDLQLKMNGHPIYAALVDMDMGEAIVSLACVADGTASLYYSTGGGQLGLGQASEDVYKATIAFLHSAEQILDKLTPVYEFPLPKNKRHIVYLVAVNGIFMQELAMEEMGGVPKELQFLQFLYQNVLYKIGEYNKQSETAAAAPAVPRAELSVEDVFYVEGNGTVVVGTVAEGIFFTGDAATVARQDGSKIKTVIKGMEQGVGHLVQQAATGEPVALLLADLTKADVGIGDVVTT